jgi:hypothetical protein|tara:strand:- start:917 stop:1222 length:306 start_codon:yes stop_codon:yes gene_type:complete
MGRTKELLVGLTLSQNEIEEELYLRNDYDYQYQSWKSSKEYVELVNDELFLTKTIYSTFDIENALQYASKSIIIEPSEIGKEVYDKLFSQKVTEYLNLKND